MKHRPRAEVLDLDLRWDAGAPMPMLIAGARNAVVLCYESLATGEDEHIIEIRSRIARTCREGTRTKMSGDMAAESLRVAAEFAAER